MLTVCVQKHDCNSKCSTERSAEETGKHAGCCNSKNSFKMFASANILTYLVLFVSSTICGE